MSHPRVTATLLAIALTACFGFAREREKQMQEVKRDEAVLKGVSAAINQVIHNATDCDAARAAMPEARQRLSEAFRLVQEPGSDATLKMLDAQLKQVADACP